ncbi:MAG: hypothetical protein R3E77_00170 [Steroidobacteraceae bacterium]
MVKQLSPRSANLKRALAQEAARIMIEHGIADFLTAKRKAAERFGVSDQGALPKNREIELALAEHQRLFGAAEHERQLRHKRDTAATVMRLLESYQPRLVGAVLAGTASAHSVIELHLFAERAELVSIALLDADIEYEVVTRRIRMGGDHQAEVPALRFGFDDEEFLALVFPVDGLRQAPLSAVDGRPMRRAGEAEVTALLAAAPAAL